MVNVARSVIAPQGDAPFSHLAIHKNLLSRGHRCELVADEYNTGTTSTTVEVLIENPPSWDYGAASEDDPKNGAYAEMSTTVQHAR